MTDVYSNIQNGKYENRVTYSALEADLIQRTYLRDAYHKEQKRIDEEFYQDCCDELGIDPKAASSEKLFWKAYQEGHSGFAEIYDHMVDLDAFVNEWAGLKLMEP